MKILEGAIYTVDDVSDLLGIPRPTLYRYLREYSIPHLRRGGRIQIPEDSFDRIREARDLHKEGLGTESVRRQIREGGGPDTGELDKRLNDLHESLEDLRGDLRSKPATTGEVALSPALRTILARQNLMLSALFNLTGMVEDLLLSHDRPRRRPLHRFADGPATVVSLPTERRGEIAGTVVVDPVEVHETEAPAVEAGVPEISDRFGTLGRRRRASLAILGALLLGAVLLLSVPTLRNAGDGTTTANPGPQDAARQPPQDKERPAPDDGPSGESPKDGAGGIVAAAQEEPAAAPRTEGGQSGDGQDAGVPDVSGRPLEEAVRTISRSGLTVSAIKVERSAEAPGTVLGTDPSAGSEKPPGAAVALTVSADEAGASVATASAAAGSLPAGIQPASASSSASASASPSP